MADAPERGDQIDRAFKVAKDGLDFVQKACDELREIFGPQRGPREAKPQDAEETKVIPKDRGKKLITGRHANAELDADGNVEELFEKDSGRTYRRGTNEGEWVVTTEKDGTLPIWYGKITAKDRTIVIEDTTSKIKTTYKPNGDRETQYLDGPTITETSQGRIVAYPVRQPFTVSPHDGRQPVPTPAPRPVGQREVTPPPAPRPEDRREVTPTPAPRPVGQREVTPPLAPRSGDRREVAPTRERPIQPPIDQPLIAVLKQLLDKVLRKAMEFGDHVFPPVAPPGTEDMGRATVVNRTDNNDGSVTYDYTDNKKAPTFIAFDKVRKDKIIEARQIVYMGEPRTIEFQPEDGLPPIKLYDVRQLKSELKSREGKDYYETTVTCEGPGGPVKHVFETALDGQVLKSPLASLPPEYFKNLTADNIKNLPIDQLKAEQIKELPPAAIPGLTTQQIEKLTSQAITGLTEEQVKALNKQQIVALLKNPNAKDSLKQAYADLLKTKLQAGLPSFRLRVPL